MSTENSEFLKTSTVEVRQQIDDCEAELRGLMGRIMESPLKPLFDRVEKIEQRLEAVEEQHVVPLRQAVDALQSAIKTGFARSGTSIMTAVNDARTDLQDQLDSCHRDTVKQMSMVLKDGLEDTGRKTREEISGARKAAEEQLNQGLGSTVQQMKLVFREFIEDGGRKTQRDIAGVEKKIGNQLDEGFGDAARQLKDLSSAQQIIGTELGRLRQEHSDQGGHLVVTMSQLGESGRSDREALAAALESVQQRTDRQLAGLRRQIRLLAGFGGAALLAVLGLLARQLQWF